MAKQPAARPGHDAGVAVHPADARVGRAALRDVRTVIVDEIHAVARRQARRAPGAVARAARRAGGARRRLQRIGLSATQRPIERRGAVARRRRRAAARDRRRRPAPRSRPGDRDPGRRAGRGRDATSSGRELYDRHRRRWRAQHRTTLVFVNTRRLVERVRAPGRAAREARRSRPTTAACRASGGSGPSSGSRQASCGWWSRPRRSSSASTSARSTWSARSARRARSRRCCSGSAAPATRCAATPKGRLFAADARPAGRVRGARARGARAADSTRSALRDAPLDVLAQQIVAPAPRARTGTRTTLFALVRRAAPYARADAAGLRRRASTCCPRASRPAAGGRARMLHRDRVNRRAARRGAGRGWRR